VACTHRLLALAAAAVEIGDSLAAEFGGPLCTNGISTSDVIKTFFKTKTKTKTKPSVQDQDQDFAS